MASDSKGSPQDTAWLAAVALVLAALILIPVLLGGLVFAAFGRYLTRRDYWAFLAVGVLGLVVLGASNVEYFVWLYELVRGTSTLQQVPVLFLTASVCVFLGLFGLVSRSAVARKRLPKKVLASLDRNRNNGAPALGESIVPTAEAKSRLKPVLPEGGALTVSASSHSITNTQPPGKRTFPLGIGHTGQYVTLSEAEVATHGVILGATGSGKSKTIEGLAGALLDLGWSGMILDLKEDTAPGGLRDWCATYASAHAIAYQELRLSDPNSKFWFNALHGMGTDEIRDAILTLSTFDDEYWQTLNKELLGQTVNLIVWAHEVDPVNFPPPTMYEIGKMLSTGNLKNASKKHRAAVLGATASPKSTNGALVTADDFRVLSDPSADQQKSAVGFGSRLTLIYDTQAGRTVLRDGTADGKRMVDVTKTGITYIGLDSQGKADLTKVISASVLQRMSVYASQRTTGAVVGVDSKSKRFLIVDEANWVDRTITQNLLSRARSAGIAMFLCTQGPKDWIDNNGDDWGKLTQNTNVAIVMRQGEPASAELCAEYIGMHRVNQTTRSRRVADGVFGEQVLREGGRLVSSESERETVDYLVDPEELRQMGVGEAVLKIGVPSRVEWMKVSLRDPAAGPRIR